MNEQDIAAYLATQYPVPIKSLTWRHDAYSFRGVAILDTSGAIKDHAEIHAGIVASKDLSDDDLKFQLGHSVDGAKDMIARLIAEKGAAEPKADA